MRLSDLTAGPVTMNSEEFELMEELAHTLTKIEPGQHTVLDLTPFAAQTLFVTMVCGLSAIKAGAAVLDE